MKDDDNALDEQIKALEQELNALNEQNAELTNQIQALQEELEQYKAIVDKRDLITTDSSIDEKFANAYKLDEPATIGGLEVKVSNISYPNDYEGIVPQSGALISGTIEIKNIGINSISCEMFYINIVDKEGRIYSKSRVRNSKELITTSGASFLASGVNLAPQFTTNETFLFHVPDANTDFLIEIVDRGTRETRYIRIKL